MLRCLQLAEMLLLETVTNISGMQIFFYVRLVLKHEKKETAVDLMHSGSLEGMAKFNPE